MTPDKPATICLCMIVRDEAHVITRCLDSVRPYIDSWLVADTGSVDDTCVTVRAYFKAAGIPGRLVHHKWENFGHNRTFAVAEAMKNGCDYLLVIDADETLHVDMPECLRTLQAPAYRIETHFGTMVYPRLHLMRTDRSWRYVGVIHEYPVADPPAPEVLLPGLHVETDGRGARGKRADKAERDLAVLQKAVVDEPDNPRYWFYLAQTYEVCKRLDEATAAYMKRTTMGDYHEEIWYSFYRTAHIAGTRDQWPIAVLRYLEAFSFDKTRAEPLYWLAVGYHNRNLDHMALLFLEQAVLINKPASALFVEPAVYDYLRWIHYCICLHNTGQRDDARELAAKVLLAGKAPEQYLAVLKRIVEPTDQGPVHA